LYPPVPENCLHRKKNGVFHPQWLRNDLRPVFEEKVFSADGFSVITWQRFCVHAMEGSSGRVPGYAFVWSVLFLGE